MKEPLLEVAAEATVDCAEMELLRGCRLESTEPGRGVFGDPDLDRAVLARLDEVDPLGPMHLRGLANFLRCDGERHRRFLSRNRRSSSFQAAKPRRMKP